MEKTIQKYPIMTYLVLYGLLLENTCTVLMQILLVFIIIFKDSKKEGRLAPSFLPTVK
jgi:hypothetical protein